MYRITNKLAYVSRTEAHQSASPGPWSSIVYRQQAEWGSPKIGPGRIVTSDV